MEYIFDSTKNEKLQKERGISFEQIVDSIEAGNVVNSIPHPNLVKYPDQYMFEVEMDGYIWRVPCKVEPNQTILKTAYPSRKATKDYRRNNNENAQ